MSRKRVVRKVVSFDWSSSNDYFFRGAFFGFIGFLLYLFLSSDGLSFVEFFLGVIGSSVLGFVIGCCLFCFYDLLFAERYVEVKE